MPPQPPLRAPYLSCPVLGGPATQVPGDPARARGWGLCRRQPAASREGGGLARPRALPQHPAHRGRSPAPPSSTAGTVDHPQLQVPCQLLSAQPGLGCLVGRGWPHAKHGPGPLPRPKNLPLEGRPPQPYSPHQGSWVAEPQAADKAERPAGHHRHPEGNALPGERATRTWRCVRAPRALAGSLTWELARGWAPLGWRKAGAARCLPWAGTRPGTCPPG